MRRVCGWVPSQLERQCSNVMQKRDLDLSLVALFFFGHVAGYGGLICLPRRLHPGRGMFVGYVLRKAEDAVVIPATALENNNGRYRVQVVDDNGKVSTRAVTVGLNNNVDAQILSGLQAGEQVIVSQASTVTSNNKAQRMGPPMGM